MDKLEKSKNSLIFTGLVLLTLLVILVSLYALDTGSQADNTGLDQIDFSYYEDTSGQLTVNDADTVWAQGSFTGNESPAFTFGRSRSTFWVRISTEKRELLKDYIALFCPNIQNVQLYIPKENGYDVHYSGWGNSLIRDDESLTYPVFRLDSDAIGEKPIYMQIQSDYSHNYTLKLYAQKELDRVRITEFCLSSFLFGMLIAVVLTNLIIYFKLKNKVSLAFSISILLLSIHQGISYGMYNVIIPMHSYVIMSLSIEIGLLFIISIIVFFIIFSDVKTYNRGYYRCLLFFIAAVSQNTLFAISTRSRQTFMGIA